ncbi:hypothetical protein MYCTH_2303238 [Thermothelomyces thermophilus ATCC 42464]|uniref:Major facilitator superfamily (MFS) profile domain-containing protein n=1 Tax=Thermothelomyces thermophilus (strain ATCC 42464 / BCRC 31852 / DSM 1799) TaxID=573729 RepID=G2QCA4_THET4|nr:uncharacterized protein MYCTH_2303238 [Thermothelomyces thermophilus ATCC 42464]AEO57279.1 hypothetical protein MYCTH_2303238 [Thermothelomyces thermophilus ATCC 42464]
MALNHPRSTPDSSAMKSEESSQTGPVDEPTNAPMNGSTSKGGDSPENMNMATKALLILSVFLSMFLVALDRTIISTAIPAITDDFNSLNDVGWYGSAYLLSSCAFQLLFGKIYTLFSVKPVFVVSTLLFEIGSVLCGAAPSSIVFIVGRAVCGVGAAGLFAGTVVCIIYIVPLHQRPKVQGMFGAIFGIASIVGPLLGGAFTSNVTWRWCFYINLPIGGVSMAVVALFFRVPQRESDQLSLAEKILRLDIAGTAVLVPGVVCLLLALQWGGPTYPWNDGRIIALLVLAGILSAAYVAVQAIFTATSTIPGRIIRQRSIASGLWATVCINSASFIFVYFLPVWFQAVRGVSPVDSGIRLLPIMLATVVGSILGGFLNARVGYYAPLAIVGTCVMAVGAGLLTTLQVDTGPGGWIGYQVLFGLGMGGCFQAPNLAVQAALPQADVPVGLALMTFGSSVASAIFVSVGQNVLTNQLVRRLSGLPGFDVGLVTSGGATALLDALPARSRGPALVAYNEALREVFRVGLILACLTIFGTATMEWLSVKKPQPEKPVAGLGGSKTGQEKEEMKTGNMKK